MVRSLCLALLLSLLVVPVGGCGDDDGSSAADGGVDGDAVAPPADGGDGGGVPRDAGPPGAALEPTEPCDDVAAELYATPSDLPPFTASARGELLGCALLETLSAEEVRSRMAAIPGAVGTGGAVRQYLVAYRTERYTGEGGISTALVYLPDVALSERVPLVLVAHGTVGVADACAPSHLLIGPENPDWPRSYVDALGLAWAARGLPVVAPDYAGLGTDGVHSTYVWSDPARSSVDGARALQALLPAARLDGTTLVSGHSQGGGIALTVPEAAAETGLDVRAVVAFAPAWRVSSLADAIGLGGVRLSPVLLVSATLALYSDYANLTDDPSRYGEPFHPDLRDAVVQRAESLCFYDLLASLQTPAAGYTPPETVADLLDPAFVEAAQACAQRDVCEGLPGAWVQQDRENDPHLPADAPPVLIVSSSDDELLTPGQLGCVIERVEADGAAADVCVHTGESHLSVVTATTAYAIDWALAAASGTERPACTGDGRRRACALF